MRHMHATAQLTGDTASPEVKASGDNPDSDVRFTRRVAQVTVKPGLTFLVVVALAALLVIIYAIGAVDPEARSASAVGEGGRFDLNAEHSFGSWLSTVIWASAGVALSGLAIRESMRRVQRRGWALLSITSFYISLDEATALHEWLSGRLSQRLGLEGSLAWSTWLVPAAVATILLIVVLRPFLLALPRRTLWLMILAGGVFVTGAGGMEVVEAVMANYVTPTSMAFSVVMAFEEFCELVGAALFLYAIYTYTARTIDVREPVFAS